MNSSSFIPSQKSSEYIPGICNIGKKEIERRKYAALFSLVLCVLCVIIIEWLQTEKMWRLLLFIPATSLGVSFQQWRSKFCVAFGIKGVFNFGDLGKTFNVEQQEYYRKDRRKALSMIFYGVVFGSIVAVLFYLV